MALSMLDLSWAHQSNHLRPNLALGQLDWPWVRSGRRQPRANLAGDSQPWSLNHVDIQHKLNSAWFSANS